jgi:hypothetical protein
MSMNWQKAVVAGIVGTLVMSAVGVWVAPMLGLPRMNPAEMLAESMGGRLALGWAVHLMIGVVLAGIYAFVAGRLPGPPPVRGALFALAPWLLAQGMGAMAPGGLTTAAVIASLIGHLVYGAVVGAIYGVRSSAE